LKLITVTTCADAQQTDFLVGERQEVLLAEPVVLSCGCYGLAEIVPLLPRLANVNVKAMRALRKLLKSKIPVG
jgi:hypothetical protein